MKKTNIVSALAEYSGGFYVRRHNSWSRVKDSESLKVFEQPVEIWFHRGDLSENDAVQLKRILRKVPEVTEIKFLDTKVTDAARMHLKKACPTAWVERATVHDRTKDEELSARYEERRDEFEKIFLTYKPVPESEVVDLSPSGRYELTKTKYTAGPSKWDFSRGVVVDIETRKKIADIKRNYGAFWHAWIIHPNGNEYLLCGEDYQGQTVINLSQEEIHTCFPEQGYNGAGFCWAQVFPSPDGLMLAVDGCYWACSYDLVFYDFRNPDVLPFVELDRTDGLHDSQGWKNNNTFVLTREIEIRKSDGALYDSLPEQEQERLDDDDSLTDYKIERIEVSRPALKDEDSV